MNTTHSHLNKPKTEENRTPNRNSSRGGGKIRVKSLKITTKSTQELSQLQLTIRKPNLKAQEAEIETLNAKFEHEI